MPAKMVSSATEDLLELAEGVPEVDVDVPADRPAGGRLPARGLGLDAELALQEARKALVAQGERAALKALVNGLAAGALDEAVEEPAVPGRRDDGAELALVAGVGADPEGERGGGLRDDDPVARRVDGARVLRQLEHAGPGAGLVGADGGVWPGHRGHTTRARTVIVWLPAALEVTRRALLSLSL